MYWYRIRKFTWAGRDRYYADYRHGLNGDWKTYSNNKKRIPGHSTWDGAYKELEQHATPAALAVRFVGTF